MEEYLFLHTYNMCMRTIYIGITSENPDVCTLYTYASFFKSCCCEKIAEFRDDISLKVFPLGLHVCEEKLFRPLTLFL